jgi:flagellar biosynthesis/type III secretory pathway protein FliH
MTVQKLTVQLPRFLSSVTSNHKVTFVAAHEGDGFGEEPPKPDAILQVVESISSQLFDIKNTVLQQNAQVKSVAAAYAMEMIRAIFQQDEPTILERIERYIELSLADNRFNTSPTVYVHPLVLEHVSEYFTGVENFDGQLEADKDLPRTDCRVEFEDNGLIASLEQQLNLMETKLNQAIVAGGAV